MKKYEIVKDIMKHKLNDALICTKEARNKLNKSKSDLVKIVIANKIKQERNYGQRRIYNNTNRENHKKIEQALK